MARTDAAHLEALKTARDAVVDGLATGQATVSYTIRGRTHTVQPSGQLLKDLEASIAVYENKVNRSSTSRYRVAKLNRTSRTGI